MQTLWSRVTQATSRCGCRACNTVAHSAGRRVAPPRRKATFTEIFTAAYTSVLASAAVLDSGFKEQRRRELDQKLDDAKRDLAALKSKNDLSLFGRQEELEAKASLEWLTDAQMIALWKTIKMIRPYFENNENDSHLLRPSDLRRRLQKLHYNCEGSSTTALWDQGGLDAIEKAILYENEHPPTSQRNPETPEQIYFTAVNLTTLVRSLLSVTQFISKNDAEASPTFQLAQKMMYERKMPWYTHQGSNSNSTMPIDYHTAQATIRDLNRACRSAILNTELGMREQVGRVCYNLMVTKSVPSMTTLNTIISGFTHNPDERFIHLTRKVVWGSFYSLRYKPTPATFAASLQSYRTEESSKKWKWLLSTIVGEDAKVGAKYMRRRVSELETDPNLRRWAADTDRRTRTGNCIHDHAPLNPLMVEQILHGLLKFGRLDSCVTFLLSCIATQVPVASKVVMAIFNECIATLDWKSAMNIVQNMVRRGQFWWALILNRDESSIAYLIDRMYSMLDMVGLGVDANWGSDERLNEKGFMKPELATFIDALAETNEALGPKVRIRIARGSAEMLDPATRASRSRTLQIESLDKELTRANLRAHRADEAIFECSHGRGIALSAPLLAHASNVALARGQVLGNEVIEILSLLRNSTAEDLCQDRKEALRKNLDLVSDMSSRDRFALGVKKYWPSIDRKLDSTRPVYGETVPEEKLVLPCWVTEYRRHKPEPSKEEVSRWWSQRQEPMRKVTRPQLVVLDEFDAMKAQRRSY